GAKEDSDTPQRVLDVREELLVVGLNCSANCIHRNENDFFLKMKFDGERKVQIRAFKEAMDIFNLLSSRAPGIAEWHVLNTQRSWLKIPDHVLIYIERTDGVEASAQRLRVEVEATLIFLSVLMPQFCVLDPFFHPLRGHVFWPRTSHCGSHLSFLEDAGSSIHLSTVQTADYHKQLSISRHLATTWHAATGSHGSPKFYQPYSEDTQQQIIRETFHLVSQRDENVCNFLEGGLLIGGSDNNLIYRHYATLYFVFCGGSSESELGILDLIQVFVETLDKCFENVCELDLIFHVFDLCDTSNTFPEPTGMRKLAQKCRQQKFVIWLIATVAFDLLIIWRMLRTVNETFTECSGAL
ncbi:hypothetical protein EI555_003877, partial [Monodon monoceros]